MKYVVEKSDLIGEIKNFTVELVQEMVDEQVRQGNNADVEVFQNQRRASQSELGFDWIGSEKGGTYWADVMEGVNIFDSEQKGSQYDSTEKSAILLANSIKSLCEVIIDCSIINDKEQIYGLLTRNFDRYFDEFNKK